ncbi:MAG: amidohydrolase family protein, partial [Bryobacteraceae bacterium]
MGRLYLLLSVALLLSGCTRIAQPALDPGLLAEIQQIRAIDNHAHPVRVTGAGEQPDREFDALPVDNMEPQSDPVNLRLQSPAIAAAEQALYGGPGGKERIQREQGDHYAAWVLDQMGVDVMLANRVTLGKSVQPPRFRWVPYADALLFPLDNSALARQNSDRKSFFALEDQLRQRYLKDAGMENIPATLSEYLARVVTPTLERHRQGGAVAEKFEAAYLRSLSFDKVDRPEAERIYRRFVRQPGPAQLEYKPLQDFLFRYIAAECGRLGMAVHVHTMAGAG